MAETVYLYDGSPKLVVTDWDYPSEPYTKIPPNEGMYYQIYIDEDKQKWVGSEPPLKNSDLQRLEDAINSQNEKFKLMIDRSNNIDNDNLNLMRYSADLLLNLAYVKKHVGYSPNVITIEDIRYFYDKNIYTDFTLRQLVDNEILTSEAYKTFTGEDYPEQPQA